MDTLTFTPSNATKGTAKPRKLKAQFGDGYVQEAADGINPSLRVWNCTWAPIPWTNVDPTKTTLKALNDFFTTEANGPIKFLWTQPPPFDTEGAMTFVCETWDWVYQGGLIVGVTAVLEQRPSV